MEVDGPLRVEPELRSGPERRTELERHLRGHRGSSIHDAVDDLDVTSDVIGELLLRHRQGLEKLFSQDLAGSGGHSATLHRYAAT